MKNNGLTIVEIMIVVLVLGILACVVIPQLSIVQKSDNQEKQTAAFEIVRLYGSDAWSPDGYQIKALHKDPNDRYTPYLSRGLSQLKEIFLKEGEEVKNVIPSKYDEHGDLLSIWVVIER